MKDADIRKALECCNSTERGHCLNKCPYYDYSANCTQAMLKDTLDLLNRQINPSDPDFGVILICAVRYSIGRRTCVPGLVIDFIRPLLPELCNKTLSVMERDIAGAGGYGDKQIDEPRWLQFLEDIRREQRRRKEDEGK